METGRKNLTKTVEEPHYLPHSFELLADQALARLWRGYEKFDTDFAAITSRAAERFEQRDWKGMHDDTVERLDLYQQVVGDTCRRIVDGLGLHAQNPRLWLAIKSRFAADLGSRPDAELACTFYNSINRRILQTVGIDSEMEFVAPAASYEACPAHPPLLFRMETDRVSAETIQGILGRFGFRAPFADLAVDSRLCAERIRLLLEKKRADGSALRIEMIRVPFFRETGAYLIGRLSWREQFVPLVFALSNTSRGLQVDALLLRTAEIRVLFSFTHTYFHVQTACPHELLRFLKLL
ncbi:MAG: bifunctional isocitrate dehydrogenase kinase/phosphatase, partial [Desulfobacterales bacterium]|nr:bifunctional isocitrate dehydrogenase kinase/phosphatase [Desulfobacterales bacterium]